MSWLSNHSLNAILTGASQLHLLQRRFHDGGDFCQNASCLDSLLKDQDGWDGVYAADKLPQVLPSTTTVTSYIVNSATAASKGQHWLAIRVLPNEVEFFDSYGQSPWQYPLIYAWIKNLKRPRIVYVNHRIQGDRAYCGAYCFYYLSERPFAPSLYATFFDNPRFVFSSLDSDTKDADLIKHYLSLNDSMVFDYLYRHTQRMLAIFDDGK